MPTIRLLIADDHPIVLDGLEQLFRLEPDLEVVGRCRDGEETLQLLRQLRPDVLILDIRMPRRDGLEVLRAIDREGLGTRVVLLTAAVDDRELIEAIQLGAGGVVLKEMAPELLVDAVRQIHAGGQWLEQGLGGRALRRLLERREGVRESGSVLSPRELEIVRMVARGLRNKAIGEKLFISEGTVKIHLHNIYDKVRVQGRMELAVYAQEKGLL